MSVSVDPYGYGTRQLHLFGFGGGDGYDGNPLQAMVGKDPGFAEDVVKFAVECLGPGAIIRCDLTATQNTNSNPDLSFGTPAWSSIDSLIFWAAKYGGRILIDFHYANSSGDPSSLPRVWPSGKCEGFASFARAVVRRYCGSNAVIKAGSTTPQGVIASTWKSTAHVFLEIWNEPNSIGTAGGTMTPARCYRFNRDALDAIMADMAARNYYVPVSVITSGAIDISFITAVLNAPKLAGDRPLLGDAHALSVHVYQKTDPVTTKDGNVRSAWTIWQTLRPLMNAHGGANCKVWVTEGISAGTDKWNRFQRFNGVAGHFKSEPSELAGFGNEGAELWEGPLGSPGGRANPPGQAAGDLSQGYVNRRFHEACDTMNKTSDATHPPAGVEMIVPHIALIRDVPNTAAGQSEQAANCTGSAKDADTAWHHYRAYATRIGHRYAGRSDWKPVAYMINSFLAAWRTGGPPPPPPPPLTQPTITSSPSSPQTLPAGAGTMPITIGATTPDSGVTLQEQVDTGAYTNMTLSGGTWTRTVSLGVGTHTFRVRATNGIDVSTADFVQIVINSDVTAPPAPTWVTRPPDNQPVGPQNFEVTDTEAGVTYERSLDGAAYIASPAIFTLTITTAGSHTINVIAKDAAGNRSAPLIYTWTVSGTSNPGPAISFIQPSDGQHITTPSTVVRANITSSFGIATARVSVNAKPAVAMAIPSGQTYYQATVALDTQSDADVVNTIEITATDRATTPVTNRSAIQVIADAVTTGPPAVTILSPTAGQTLIFDIGDPPPWADMRVRATSPAGISRVRARVGVVPWTTLTREATTGDYVGRVPLNGTEGTDVTNTITVEATDAAGATVAQSTDESVTVVVRVPFGGTGGDAGGGGTSPPPGPGEDLVEPARGVARYLITLVTLSGRTVAILDLTRSESLTHRHLGLDEFSFTLPLDHPQADMIGSLGSVVKVWRSIDGAAIVADEPDYCGIVGPWTEDGNANTFTVNTYGPAWRLTRRFVREHIDTGTIDQGEILLSLLDATNALDATGIERGQLTQTVDRQREYDRGQQIWQAWLDLGTVLGGPEWRIRYVHIENDPTLAVVDVAGVFGTWQPAARVDYAAGRQNASQMQRGSNVEQFTNELVLTGQGDDKYTPYADVPDAQSILDFTLYEAYENLSDANTIDYLNAYAADEIKTRKRPIILATPTIQPGEGPFYGRNFYLGDVLPVSASRGRMRFSNQPLRVYEAKIDRTESGMESQTLTMGEDTTGAIAP